MEAVAKIKNCPMSARKMRLVCNNIRGLEVDKALNILRFTKKEAAIWLEKLVLSAIANWEQKTGEDSDDYDLFIKTIFSDQGPQMKRFRPAPYGRAHRIRKHSNHVTLVIENAVLLPSEEEGYEEINEEAVVETAVNDNQE